MAELTGAMRAVPTTRAPRTRPIAWWLRVVVVLGALLTAMGAVIALINPQMLVSPHEEINGAVHIYAGYLFARNSAIALMLIALLAMGASRALGNLMVLVGFIQLLDVCMDIAEGRWEVAPGVLVFGVVFLVAAARLSGYAFWRLEAWRQ
jgi:hypothetical protein